MRALLVVGVDENDQTLLQKGLVFSSKWNARGGSMPGYAYAILVAGWLTWVAPFLRTLRGLARPKSLDRRARWGILLVAVAYSILWQGKFWERQPSTARVATSTAFFLLAAVLSWTATTS